MTEKKLDLDGQVMKLSAKKEEDDHTIEVLNSKIQQLTSQLLIRGIEVSDLKAKL